MPFSSLITAATGSWHTVFYVAAGMNALAAVMALLVLKPMLRRHHALGASSPMPVTKPALA